MVNLSGNPILKDSKSNLSKFLHIRSTAIGVASFAHKNIRKCGKWPGGFARITTELVSWIRYATGSENQI